MNYLNKVEKTLKSCLKEKLTITTATVVAFLITGAFASAQDNVQVITGENTNKTIKVEDNKNLKLKDNKGELVFEGKIGHEDRWIGHGIEIQSGNNKVTNKAEITADIGINVFNGANHILSANEVVNEGTINAARAGIAQTLQSGYVNTIINKGDIKVATKNGINMNKQVLGVVLKGDTTFINDGNVSVTATTKDSIGTTTSLVGLKLEEGIKATNNGTITVDSTIEAVPEKDSTGIKNVIGAYVSANNGKDTELTNNGSITVKGNEGVIGVLISEPGSANAGEKGTTAKVVNGTTGKISVAGSKAVGVKLGEIGDSINRTKVTKEFTNDGTITLEKGTTGGIGIHVQNGKAVNNGTIALEIGTTGTDEKAATENLAIKNEKGEAINVGKIKVTDKTAEELKGYDINKLFAGTVANKGMLVDKDGNMVSQKDDIEINGDLTSDQINNAGTVPGAGSVVITGTSNLTGGEKPVEVDAVNIAGSLEIKNGESSKGVAFNKTNINIDKAGSITIGKGEKADLTITEGSVNGGDKEKDGYDIVLGNNGSSLTLVGSSVTGNIGTAVAGGSYALGGAQGNTVKVLGDSSLKGQIDVTTIEIGSDASPMIAKKENGKTNKFTLSSDSFIGKGKVEREEATANTINIATNGQLVLEVGANGENALANSNGVQITGTNNEDIALDLSNMSGEGTTISLGGKDNNKFTSVDVTTTNGNNGVYIVEDGNLATTGSVAVEYNKNLYANNSVLNGINNQAVEVSNMFSSDIAVRSKQLDTIYASNIYSQTVRAAYDNIKLNEKTVLDLGRTTEVGKWTATGVYLNTDSSSESTGTISNYKTDIDSKGLLANIEYGLNEKSSVGFVFSGIKQDVDTVGGSAEGDVFYLGAYNKTLLGKGIDLTYGAGFQLGSYDADNYAGNTQTSSSYDSNSYGLFAQVKKDIELGENLTFVPKFKLGYTYVDQDNVRDSYFGLDDASMSTMDANLGFGLSKEISMEKGKVTLTTGVDFTTVHGDTDKEFKGSFNGKNGTRNYFNVLGADVAEDTATVSVMGTVEQNNGMFYNLGLSHRFGDNETKETNVQAGLGYKF